MPGVNGEALHLKTSGSNSWRECRQFKTKNVKNRWELTEYFNFLGVDFCLPENGTSYVSDNAWRLENSGDSS